MSGAVLAVGAAGAGTLGIAAAAADTSNNKQSSLIDTLVSRFNLNKEEVQQVFDEERTAQETEREQKMKERLDTLVTDGKLTQEQADKLTAKAVELKEQHEANKEVFANKTEEERRAAFAEARDSLKQWLSDNGIAEEYGRFIVGGGRSHGPGGPGPEFKINN